MLAPTAILGPMQSLLADRLIGEGSCLFWLGLFGDIHGGVGGAEQAVAG